MLNEQQKEWLLPKCKALLDYAGDFSEFNDQKWENIVEFTDKVAHQAKGNREVIDTLLATVTYIEKMEKIVNGRI